VRARRQDPWLDDSVDAPGGKSSRLVNLSRHVDIQKSHSTDENEYQCKTFIEARLSVHSTVI
jgi:hypothetical protein